MLIVQLPMKRNRIVFFLLFIACVVTGCKQPSPPSPPPVEHAGWLIIPENKMWAHRVNDTVTAQLKEQLFGGLEFDLVFSPTQHELFVCHDDDDTLKQLTLHQYLAAIKHPEQLSFWLDIKNLNIWTADEVSLLVKEELEHYGIVDRAFIENPNSRTLQKVKEHKLHTSLWVDNFYWQDIDTASWVEKVTSQIERAHPDAISCEYRMFGALTQFFYDKNIFLWHTPADLTLENAELTLTLCEHSSVKVVLVDYDKPLTPWTMFTLKVRRFFSGPSKS